MATEAEKEKLREVLYPLRSPCIVNLGAYQGEDEEWHREACREQVHYVMVEPDVRNAQVILDNGGISQTRRLIIGAVAKHSGDVVFYGNALSDAHRGSGSIRPPDEHLKFFPDIHFPEAAKTVVPAYSLDDIFKREWLSKIDLLWCDVQGAEADMIRGGQNALSHTRYLFLETETARLYSGMALKEELLGMLAGWKLIEDFRENCLLHNPAFL